MNYGCASEESTVSLSFNRGNRYLEFRTTVLGDTSESTTLPESTTLFESTTGPESTTWTESTTLTELSTSTGPSASTTVIDTASASGPRGNNNTGSIVGGVLGGLALVCFMVLGVMFLRHRGRHAPSVTNSNPDPGHIKAELDVTPSPNPYPATSTIHSPTQAGVNGSKVTPSNDNEMQMRHSHFNNVQEIIHLDFHVAAQNMSAHELGGNVPDNYR